MGGITSGVGIFSGIDTRSLIDQLIAIESRPKLLAQQRIFQLQSQQAAYLSVNSALSGLKSATSAFLTSKVFDSNKASSSNEAVLTATASNNAAAGSYGFLVHRLVTTQQQLSRGFSDKDAAGVGASQFSFELGAGGVTTETELAELNGGGGVERGKIDITDRSGATATIDLSTAVTVQDVVDSINAASTISVAASVEGDRLVLSDASGGGGNLIVSDVFGSSTATSLGIAGSVASDTMTGGDIRYLSSNTALRSLNDGAGVHIVDGPSTPELQITARDGSVLSINLGEITGQFFTEDWEGHAADDPVPEPPPANIEEAPTEERVVQPRATTVQDVIDIINQTATDAGVDLVAGISGSGDGLVINDNTAGGGNLIIASQGSGTTAEDLGIATAGVASDTLIGRRVIASINSVLVSNLNGGSGLTETQLSFTDRAGDSLTFDLSAAALDGSMADIVDEINTALGASSVDITVGLNRAGNGLSLTETSGGSGNLIVGGAAASELGIENAGVAASNLEGVNLQKRWITQATELGDLINGQGIGTGQIRITDSTGGSSVMDIGSGQRTVGELISFLNSRPGIDITASINDTGDGIMITDNAGGGQDLVIEDVSGTVARTLNIAGEFADDGGVTRADGSFERVVEFDANDSLQDIVNKINSEGVGVSASIINDGSASSPYRISLTSRYSGSAGRAIIDTRGFDLSLSTLSKGDDAIAFFGSDDPAKAVLLTSSTNTLDNVIQGVTIDMNATSTEPVEVVISRDTGSIETAVQDMVDAYNAVIEAIDSKTFYDAETESRGVLLGDSTLSNVRSSLYRTVQSKPVGVDSQFEYLFQVGVKIGSGSKLEFDRDRFRGALETDFESVQDLFSASKRAPNEPIELAPGITTPNTEESFEQMGLAEQIKQYVEAMTDSVDGLLTGRDNTLDSLIGIQEDRIDAYDIQLANKREVLSREFLAMEQAIASLQSQQSALASLQMIG